MKIQSGSNVYDHKALAGAGVVLAIAALARVLPHTANVTPFMAAAMVAGFVLGQKRRSIAVSLTIAAMIISDAIVGFHWTAPFVYFGMAVAALMGGMFDSVLSHFRSTRVKGLAIAGLGAVGTSAFASAAFFAISNIGVWLVGELYPLTLVGLTECFVLAIPFFKNSFATDMIFGTAFLAVAAIAKLQMPKNSIVVSAASTSV